MRYTLSFSPTERADLAHDLVDEQVNFEAIGTYHCTQGKSYLFPPAQPPGYALPYPVEHPEQYLRVLDLLPPRYREQLRARIRATTQAFIQEIAGYLPEAVVVEQRGRGPAVVIARTPEALELSASVAGCVEQAERPRRGRAPSKAKPRWLRF
jgi:hypothetical protein